MIPPRAASIAHLSPTNLVELAGPAAYERGVGYLHEGRVGPLTFDDQKAKATVEGTSLYEVEIGEVDGEPVWACSCPAADDGSFCKHVVALYLTLHAPTSEVEAGGRGTATTASTGSASTGAEALRRHFAGKPKEELIELLVDQVEEDSRLADRFRLEMARAHPAGPDVRTYRRAIDEATAIFEFIHYRRSFDYARGVEEVVTAIGDLLDEGHAAAVIDLTEHALARIEGALGRMDDSAGLIGPIMDELERLHLEACRQAPPDPVALARRLFEREIGSEWDVFDQAILRYGELLGTEGRDTYRRLASERWSRVRTLGPGERDSERGYDRFRIARMMEALAEADGDLDARIDVMARDLSLPYHYLRIANVLSEWGKDDRALEWAERGLAESLRPDHRLSDFVAREYQRRGRTDEALALAWREFERTPRLDRYAALRRHAEPADAWPAWRERALALLRERPDGSGIVPVLLSEGEADAAWAEAQRAGCTEDLWLSLAEARADAHPDDAIPIYRRAVERAIDRTNKQGYRKAVELMGIVQQLMRKAGRPEAFEEYVREVRAAHRRKRNLMALLDDRPEWEGR